MAISYKNELKDFINDLLSTGADNLTLVFIVERINTLPLYSKKRTLGITKDVISILQDHESDLWRDLVKYL